MVHRLDKDVEMLRTRITTADSDDTLANSMQVDSFIYPFNHSFIHSTADSDDTLANTMQVDSFIHSFIQPTTD